MPRKADRGKHTPQAETRNLYRKIYYVTILFVARYCLRRTFYRQSVLLQRPHTHAHTHARARVFLTSHNAGSFCFIHAVDCNKLSITYHYTVNSPGIAILSGCHCSCVLGDGRFHDVLYDFRCVYLQSIKNALLAK